MRIVASLALTLPLFVTAAAGLSSVASCNNASSASQDGGGSTFPVADGQLCACQTPECLPNCSDLPVCVLTCTDENGPDGGATLLWLDPCGKTQYAQVCAPGCADASCR